MPSITHKIRVLFVFVDATSVFQRHFLFRDNKWHCVVCSFTERKHGDTSSISQHSIMSQQELCCRWLGSCFLLILDSLIQVLLSLPFSVLNEWVPYAHAHRISKFINKSESHDGNIVKWIQQKHALIMCVYSSKAQFVQFTQLCPHLYLTL